ncbi:hypothetical protein HPB49_003554 [Dermacentor silvarum]|uniref:Uncharacterized protein n=1 Tax=Dermacentor silvarum TaxID=543639 RepID=A0ACB8CD73_DERSI|nr:hypothetical protein HPB49_003554 [Dermacentor silvarum]
MEVYDDDEFITRYRFTKQTVRELLAFLPLETSGDNRGLPLTPLLQLLVALRFYGAGTFQIVSGDLVNVSQPTVCRTVKKVTRLIARHLFRAVVRFPDASQLYNKAHIKTRNSIERAFGVWKRRFPCLDMKLQHKPQNAARIITACAALHNVALLRQEPEPIGLHVPTSRCRRTGRNTCQEHLPSVNGVGDNIPGMRARQLLIQRSFS